MHVEEYTNHRQPPLRRYSRLSQTVTEWQERNTKRNGEGGEMLQEAGKPPDILKILSSPPSLGPRTIWKSPSLWSSAEGRVKECARVCVCVCVCVCVRVCQSEPRGLKWSQWQVQSHGILAYCRQVRTPSFKTVLWPSSRSPASTRGGLRTRPSSSPARSAEEDDPVWNVLAERYALRARRGSSDAGHILHP